LTTTTTTADELLVDTARKVFIETCTFEVVEAAERDGWAASVWEAVAGVGLPWVGVPEAVGGVGGTLADALAVLRLAGQHSAPIPLAETGLLAGWLLASAGLPVGQGPATVVPGSARDSLSLGGGRLTGTAFGVPWASAVERIVLLVEDGGRWKVGSIAAVDAEVERSLNLAGEPRDTITLDGVPVELAPTDVDAAAFERRGALTRVVLMAGALDAMSRLTLDYTAGREQFGRPVARFQLVQEHLVHCAQDAALVGIAADAASRAAVLGDASFEIAAAKALASRAATTATRAAHQAHGAMGMTREYALHHLSRRLWAWRSEFGDEHRWNNEVGTAAIAAGADELYPLVANGSDRRTRT